VALPYCAPDTQRGCYDGFKYNTCHGAQMTATTPKNDPRTAPPMTDEADIGSGEKTPGHAETEEMIRQIPPLPPSGDNSDKDSSGKDQVRQP
jgi:hypothetical protein